MRKKFTGRKLLLSFVAVLTLAISSCNNSDDGDRRNDAPRVQFAALVNDNQIAIYDAQQMGGSSQPVTITGISGEQILSIDFRPATGQLYAVTNASRLYVINWATGVATPIGSGPFTPAIEGNMASIDFNPTVDRIRLVTNTGQNLRLHPETGAVAFTDGSISGGSSPMIGGVAYTENFSGTTNTTLFDIDITSNKLYRQNPPNDGVLEEVGDLGVDVTGVHGFDISVDQNQAIAILEVSGQRALYSINLQSGAATVVSDPIPTNIRSIATIVNSVAYAVDADNEMHIFNPFGEISTSNIITKEVTGLASGEHLVGLDFRPVNGQLYGLGSAGNLYTLNTSSGAAARVGSGPLMPAINGEMFGFDFNPTVDRIRIVSNTDQNLRVHPETGAVAFVDGDLNPAGERIIAAGYTNSTYDALANESATTELFVIGAERSALFLQNPPNDGTLVSRGSLGIQPEGTAGFDVITVYDRGNIGNVGFGIFTIGGQTSFFQVDLQNGATRAGGQFPKQVTGLAMGFNF